MVWAGYEKTLNWYTRFAQALKRRQYYAKAIEQFNIALSMNPKAWDALYGKAGCLSALSKVDEALTLMRECAALQPESIVGTKTYREMMYEGAETEYDMRNYDQALGVLAQMLDRNPDSEDCIDTYIRCRAAFNGQKQKYHPLAKALQALRKTRSKRSGVELSGLSNFLLHRRVLQVKWLDIIVQTLREEEDIGYAIDVITEALNDSQRTSNPLVAGVLLYAAGRCIFYKQGDLTAAIKCTRAGMAIDERTASRYDENTLSAYAQGVIQLTGLMGQALIFAHTENDPVELNRWSKELQQTYIDKTINLAAVDLQAEEVCAYYYALGIRLRGGRTRAWNLLLPRLRSIGTRLSSEVNADEWRNWRDVHALFQAIGDLDGVLAATQLQYLCYTKTAATSEGSGQGLGEKAEKIVRFTHFCDGTCSRGADMSVEDTEFYHCLYCHDVDFCQGCMEKLKAGGIPLTLCSGTHEFLTLRPFPKPSAGHVQLGQAEIAIEDWIKTWRRAD